MPSVKLSPLFNGQTIAADGAPAVGYKVHTYASGSSSELATYVSSAGSVAQANPIIFNANGYPGNPIWLQAGLAYKFVLTDENDVQVGTWDNISGINDTAASFSQWLSSSVTPTYASASSFTLPGDQTPEFHAGRRVQCLVISGTVYGTIESSVYGLLTTVTVRLDSGALDSSLSTANLSILRADTAALPYAPRQIAQMQSSTSTAVATGSTIIPFDDTIPQQTEGDQYFSLAFTPKNAASTLEIEVTLFLCNSGSGNLMAAIFQDANADAIAVGAIRNESTGFPTNFKFTHRMTAGTTSAATFKVRAGSTAAGTTTINGVAGARMLGGKLVSGIVIKEILP